MGYSATSGELQFVGAPDNGFGQIRLAPNGTGQYGLMIRNDGADTYFLTTDVNDSLGTWNSNRPLRINNSTGKVYIGNGLEVTGNTTVNFNNAATTNGVCHDGADIDGTGGGARNLVACSATPNDYAEFYPTETNVQAGDIVAATQNMLTYNAEGANAETGQVFSMGQKQISILKKAAPGDQSFGIVSTAPYQTIGKDIPVSAHRLPIALNGRVPLKVSGENGAIAAGDYITLSATLPGHGAKAIVAGKTVGRALEPFNGTTGTIMVYVENSFYTPPMQNAVLQNGNANLASINVTGNAQFATVSISGDLTVHGNVTIAGTVQTGDIYVNGHIASHGPAPATTIGAALGAGQGGGVNDPIAALDGTDTAGTVTVTAGVQNLMSGVLAHIDFSKDYGMSYKVVVSASNDAAADLKLYVVKTANGFDVVTKDTVVAGRQYQIDYIVIGAQN